MTAVELVRSVISLTQIYSQQVASQEDVLTQKDKNAHLNTMIQKYELEEAETVA